MKRFDASQIFATVIIGTSLYFGLAYVSPLDAQEMQPDDAPSYATGGEHVRGRIAAIRDAYTLVVRDDRGFLDTVRLHKGTIINPTGLRLAPGMGVVILGRNQGASFAADEIDTPYAYAHRYRGERTTVIIAPHVGW